MSTRSGHEKICKVYNRRDTNVKPIYRWICLMQNTVRAKLQVEEVTRVVENKVLTLYLYCQSWIRAAHDKELTRADKRHV